MIYLPGFKFLSLHQDRILKIIDMKVHDLMKKMVNYLNNLGLTFNKPGIFPKRMDFKFFRDLHSPLVYAFINSKI